MTKGDSSESPFFLPQLLCMNSLPTDPTCFDHQAHLKLAFDFLQALPLQEALEATEKFLLDYVTSKGAKDKFNVTLTRASVLLIQDRRQNKQGQSFEAFLKANPELVTNFIGEIHRYYSPLLLASAQAKATWVAPDLRQFNLSKEQE